MYIYILTLAISIYIHIYIYVHYKYIYIYIYTHAQRLCRLGSQLARWIAAILGSGSAGNGGADEILSTVGREAQTGLPLRGRVVITIIASVIFHSGHNYEYDCCYNYYQHHCYCCYYFIIIVRIW